MQLVYAAATQAIDFDPSDEKLYSNRSLCWMRLGQADQALTDARICRELKPNLKFDEAANAFYEGVKLEPENMELVNAFREAVEAGRQFHVRMNKIRLQKAVAATASSNSRTRSFLSRLRTLFGEEIVDPKTRDETPVTVSVDDGIRPGTTLADLAKLKLVFKKDGSTTAVQMSKERWHKNRNELPLAKELQQAAEEQKRAAEQWVKEQVKDIVNMLKTLKPPSPPPELVS
ncbi:ankyrin repeat family protein [Tanacetum coccineum]